MLALYAERSIDSGGASFAASIATETGASFGSAFDAFIAAGCLPHAQKRSAHIIEHTRHPNVRRCFGIINILTSGDERARLHNVNLPAHNSPFDVLLTIFEDTFDFRRGTRKTPYHIIC